MGNYSFINAIINDVRFLLLRLYSVLSLALKLEHHSREDGWRVSGVGLTGV